MSPRTARRLSWSLLGLTAIVAIIGDTALLMVDNSAVPPEMSDRDAILVVSVAVLIFPLVGAIICSSPRRNVIGWLFITVGLFSSFTLPLDPYLRYTLFDSPGSLPAPGYIALFASLNEGVFFSTVPTLLLLLFPTGKLPSRRWRFLAWAVFAHAIVGIPFTLFRPGDTYGYPVDNPLGLTASGTADAIGGVLGLVQGSLVLLAFASVAVRYRGAGPIEKHQLKWFSYAAGLVAIGFCAALASPKTGVVDDITWSIWAVGLLSLPVAVGIAILRYRLYDIDLIINRTLVYGALTAFLAGLYAASVQLSKLLFDDVTGGSDAALVLTTLILAAAFTPAKNALQRTVDRYYGHIHDPARELRDYADSVRALIHVLDVDESARQFLDRAVRALDSIGGALYLSDHGAARLVATAGDFDEVAALRIPLRHDSVELGYLLLAPRREGAAYADDALTTLQSTADLVAHAIALSRRAPSASLLPQEVT